MIPEYIHDYFEWLIGIVDDPGIRKSYKELLWYLFEKEYVWHVELDENRAADGVDIRSEYISEKGLFDEPVAMDLEIRPCSLLEMLIAFAARIERDVTGEPGNDHPEKWFWMFIENLGLKDASDSNWRKVPVREHVRDQVEMFLERDISYNGEGGLFPLRRPPEDQKKVQLWTQMQSYLNENYSF